MVRLDAICWLNELVALIIRVTGGDLPLGCSKALFSDPFCIKCARPLLDAP